MSDAEVIGANDVGALPVEVVRLTPSDRAKLALANFESLPKDQQKVSALLSGIEQQIREGMKDSTAEAVRVAKEAAESPAQKKALNDRFNIAAG